MMEQQKNENDASVQLGVKAHERDYKCSDFDFNNIEDILDFSTCHSHKTVNKNKKLMKLPPQRHKMIAEEPDELFEIQPEIDSLVEQSSDDNEKGELKEVAPECIREREFQCNVCEHKFSRPSHLHRHMHTHTGAKPYSCEICRKRFSRSDHLQIHERSHYKHKIHSCCVCGRLYFDLQLFTVHCRLHAECEYMKASGITAKESEAHIKKQLQTVQNAIPVSVCAEQIALLGCIKIEEVDTHTGEYIACDNNYVCSPHHQTVSICSSQVTLHSNDAI